MKKRRFKWTKTNYLGPHEWVKYDDIGFPTWDKYAQNILLHGYNRKRSFRGNPPKTYRYWNHNGYRYWIVGNILNRAKLLQGEKK